MAKVNKNIVDDALSLSLNERVELVEKLLESLDTPNTELNKIWSEESDARIQAYEKNSFPLNLSSEVLQKYR